MSAGAEVVMLSPGNRMVLDGIETSLWVELVSMVSRARREGGGGLDGAVISNVDCSFRHSGEYIVLHVEVGAGEDVHTKAGDYKARELESGSASGE